MAHLAWRYVAIGMALYVLVAAVVGWPLDGWLFVVLLVSCVVAAVTWPEADAGQLVYVADEHHWWPGSEWAYVEPGSDEGDTHVLRYVGDELGVLRFLDEEARRTVTGRELREHHRAVWR